MSQKIDPPRPSLSQRALAARPMPYLDELNAQQRIAVEALDGPVLMLAGAGTGKTKALTSRIVHLFNTGRATPRQVLAVTFTNKAAREMKLRIGRMVGEQVEGMRWLGTFHSVCVKILRNHVELAGLRPNFTILDSDDQLRLLKQLIEADGIDAKQWPPRHLAGVIDGWKNRAFTPETVPTEEASAFDGRAVALYGQYQRRLLELNAVDFGDILLHVVRIFQKHPNVLQRYQAEFQYILVDEYQDTNTVQYMWLRLLAAQHHNICCVGDDDQSIYGWRGAEVGNILRFEKDFPGATVVRLEQNYRSNAHILGAASSVISHNSDRLGKTLWTAQEGGEKVRLIGHWDGEEEARWIGEEIESLQRGTRGSDPVSLDAMAILVRASHQMRAFEDRFLTIGLPYRVIGGPRFYERLEIRDAMAYFRLAVSPSDDLAFERVVNTPKRGLGDKAIQTLQMTARERQSSLLDAAGFVVENRLLSAKALTALGQFVTQMYRWHADVLAGRSHIELAEEILDESGYTEMWQKDKSPEAAGRLENLKELVKGLENFENLQGFLEHVSLIMDNESETSGPMVSIMTLHGAKGLEFPAVFLPGWEDGLFPSQRALDETGKRGLEEERRLAYVGITRAEDLCYISFAGNRRLYGQWQSALPSRFIDELDETHIDVLTPPGLYGGGYGAAATAPSQLHTRATKADVYNSPGWKRMQEQGVQKGISSGFKTPGGFTLNAKAESVITVGERVFNNKYGYGEVVGFEGDKLRVAFDKAGEKKVMAHFVVPADQAGEVPF